jgi:beta-1,4-mannosyltransferase
VKVLSGPIDGSRHANAYVRFLLDGLDDVVALDGFTWRRALLGDHDVIHLHWVEHMLDNTGTGRRAWPKTAVLGAVVALAKLRGTKLVWTVHNEAPHERPRLPVRIGLGMWRRATDAAVFLTDAGRASHPQRFPRTAVIRHGHYRPLVDGAATPTPPRCRPYLLSIGQLRAYKGLDRLVAAMGSTSGSYDVVIAGPDRDGSQSALLRSLAGDDPRVCIDARFVPDDELVALVRSSAGVVLPYLRMNNSGALLLALSAGAPVLVPDTPVNHEIASLVGEGWVTTFAGELTAADLDAFAAAPRPDTGPDLSAFDWDAVVADHVALYRELVAV